MESSLALHYGIEQDKPPDRQLYLGYCWSAQQATRPRISGDIQKALSDKAAAHNLLKQDTWWFRFGYVR